MSDEALQLARWCAWSDRDKAHFEKYGESDPTFDEPEPRVPNLDYTDPDVALTLLSGAVIAQHEEIETLRVALGEALDIAKSNTFTPLPANWSGVITVDSGKPYRDATRIEELRKLVTP